MDAAIQRQMIRTRLRTNMEIPERDFAFLREHPEDAEWLRDTVGPVLWSKLESLSKQQENREQTCQDCKNKPGGC